MERAPVSSAEQWRLHRPFKRAFRSRILAMDVLGEEPSS